MHLSLTPGWNAEVDRCHEWICLRLLGPPGDTPTSRLASAIRKFLRSELADCLVLEMDQVLRMSGRLMRQLMQLDQDLAREGGSLRLVGLSEECYLAFERMKLQSRFPRYRSRHHAFAGHRPGRPR